MAAVPSFESSDESGEDEGIEMTAAEVLHKLEEAWLNEKFSETILDNKSDIVECMMTQITEMEENISRARKGDFKVSLHRMEIDRIRYVLSSYLRIRLHKLEKYTQFVLQSESSAETPCLSPEELEFAKEYQSLTENHLFNMSLKNMPPNLQKMDTQKTTIRPNLDSYVFFRVNEDVEGVVVDEETDTAGEEIVNLEKGDQHVMIFRPIKELVSSGAVSLI